MIQCSIDNVKFRLKEAHDFSWLARYGKVFTVFDEQDSGNISFGVEQDGKKYFIKYAGAKTIDYSGDPGEAVSRLAHVAQIYEDLKHPCLINYLESFYAGNGFATIFEWFAGECLNSHWLFTPQEKYTHPDSPNFKFNHLSKKKQLIAFNKILEFHKHVEEMGYVAIDFYDGSIMYNFSTDELKICDIDLYAKRPYVNNMGRLWGSKRFMSPEEFTLGASIDEKTNVFNMGAVAFDFFGGTLDRSKDKWTIDEYYYNIALKAVSKNRDERYSSVEELWQVWNGCASRRS